TPLKPGSHLPFKNSRRLFKVDGHHYLLKEGMKELIELAVERGISISFFSGGKKERNVALLKKIRLESGESLFSLSKKILSFQDLTEVSTDINLHFSERYKKDIKKVHENLDEVILLEDIPHFGKGQSLRQTAWLGETTFPRIRGKTIEESQNYWRKFDVEERFLPQSIEQDWWQKRKVFLLIKELEEGNTDTQAILNSINDWGFSEKRAPKNISEYFLESSRYQDFLRRAPCPKLIFN
ncbi:MAG: hypothetical protein NXH75_18020, partial [Halobacteriovoraceae bacterium]|nr:hypothetical protein [Halobacteriovoraceae bacterium]